jgi:hypothetical protein
MAKASTTIGGLTFTARSDGGSGNLIGIAIAISASPVFATASGRLITITLQHNGTALTTSISTRAAVKAAIEANPAVNALIESTTATGTFPYTDPPVGFIYLTGGSEVLIAEDIDVTASLNPTRIRHVILGGAIVAVSALMSAGTRLTGRALVTAASSASASASVASANIVQAAASVTASSVSAGACRLLAGGVVAARGAATSIAAINAFYSVSGRIVAQSSAVVNTGTLFLAGSQLRATCVATATADLIRTGLTICDVVRDILLSWGMEQPCSTPKMAKIAAVNILNQALQVLWNQAKDRNYWTQSTASLVFAANVRELDMENAIQNVVGPARLSTGETLVPLANISEIENFENSFLESTTSAKPCAYFIERNFQAGADPARCRMMISPAPATQVTVNIDVVNEAPRFTIIDLESCPLCPIPHKYVESLLLPVCRYLAMHSHLFIQRDRQEVIAQGYAQARQLLDVADPLPGLSGENRKFRKEGES